MAKWMKKNPLCLVMGAMALVFFLSCREMIDIGKGNENQQDGQGEQQEQENENNSESIAKYELWSQGTRLRGANIYQRRVYLELDGDEFMGPGPVGPPYTQADFDRLAQMGANYVNVSHPGIYTEKAPFRLDTDILDNLTDLVSRIGQADMFAVISFRTGPGRSEFTFFWGEEGDWFDRSYYNDRVWRERGIQDAWVEMWREAADRLAGNPYVVGYDLMVEPNSNEVWLDIWEPDEFYPRYADTLYDWNRLYPRIITAIRQSDPHTPILVGGLCYSAVNWLSYLETVPDEKTVYAVHQYEPFVYTHQEPGGRNTYPGNFDADYDGDVDYVDKNWLVDLLTVVDDFKARHGVAVACNEFGAVRWVPGAAAFMDDLMGLFEEKGMNHALWVWDPAYEPLTEENNAFNFRFGPNPDNIEEVENSALIRVIKKYWDHNTHRPSNVTFSE